MKIFRRTPQKTDAQPGETSQPVASPAAQPLVSTPPLELDISPADPLVAYLVKVSGVVEVDRLDLDSPALNTLKQNGIKLIVPLVSQGELIGALNLGTRRSEQDYSTDDRRLLHTLATQAAPALRVAQLVQQQQVETRQRERIDQELRVARLVQQTLLPSDVPHPSGWEIAAYWQPARTVSGDFYDFLIFPDGKLGIVVADVTDKGIPAAMVMATTRSIIRSTGELLVWPGQVLEQANNLLCPNMPQNMFVTCLYAILDPITGLIRYANAGHPPAYQRTGQEVHEFSARGMPLGLMPDMHYEEKEATIKPGDSLIMYSDGLVEAHNVQAEMFGFPRLRQLLTIPACGDELIQCMLQELNTFTGPDWEQEDDVTFVTLERLHIPDRIPDMGEGWQVLAEFSLPSEPGNEKVVMEEVVKAVQALNLPPARMDRLRTAVAEATMNALEHGNQYQIDTPGEVMVSASESQLKIEITDQGGGRRPT
jgi:serine phosphatase RsbU (regulator of sigma subunit)